MKKLFVILLLTASLSACSKMGSGVLSQMIGNWAEITPPAGCKVRQIAASSDAGVAVLCEDGRVFH